jgi:hypothetical protein
MAVTHKAVSAGARRKKRWDWEGIEDEEEDGRKGPRKKKERTNKRRLTGGTTSTTKGCSSNLQFPPFPIMLCRLILLEEHTPCVHFGLFFLNLCI